MDRKLKLLMIAPTPFFADRGCHMRILGEIRALEKLGYDITLCTYHIGRDIPGIKTERILNIPWYNKLEAGSSWHKFYIDILLFFKSLQRSSGAKNRISSTGISMKGPSWGILSASSVSAGCPLVFDAQGSLTRELITYGFFKEGSFFQKVFWRLEKWISWMPEYTVGSNVSVSNFMVEEMHLPASRVSTVIDGVHTDFFSKNPPEKEISERNWGFPPKTRWSFIPGLC